MQTATLVAAILAVSSLAPASEPPDARSIDAQIRSNRERWKSGRFLLTHRYIINKSDPTCETIRSKFSVMFDGNSVRSIVNRRSPLREWTTRTVFTGDNFISDWSEDFAVQARRIDEYRGKRPSITADAFDPRQVGVNPNRLSTLYLMDVAGLFGFQPSTKAKVTSDSLDGEECWLIEYSLPGDQLMRAWVSPRMDMEPVRIEITGKAENGHTPKIAITCSYKKCLRENTWFPSRLSYCEMMGDETLMKEIADISDPELNVEIDPSYFGFERLGLKLGRAVMGTGNHRLLWDGKNLIEDRPEVFQSGFDDPAGR